MGSNLEHEHQSIPQNDKYESTAGSRGKSDKLPEGPEAPIYSTMASSFTNNVSEQSSCSFLNASSQLIDASCGDDFVQNLSLSRTPRVSSASNDSYTSATNNTSLEEKDLVDSPTYLSAQETAPRRLPLSDITNISANKSASRTNGERYSPQSTLMSSRSSAQLFNNLIRLNDESNSGSGLPHNPFLYKRYSDTNLALPKKTQKVQDYYEHLADIHCYNQPTSFFNNNQDENNNNKERNCITPSMNNSPEEKIESFEEKLAIENSDLKKLKDLDPDQKSRVMKEQMQQYNASKGTTSHGSAFLTMPYSPPKKSSSAIDISSQMHSNNFLENPPKPITVSNTNQGLLNDQMEKCLNILNLEDHEPVINTSRNLNAISGPQFHHQFAQNSFSRQYHATGPVFGDIDSLSAARQRVQSLPNHMDYLNSEQYHNFRSRQSLQYPSRRPNINARGVNRLPCLHHPNSYSKLNGLQNNIMGQSIQKSIQVEQSPQFWNETQYNHYMHPHNQSGSQPQSHLHHHQQQPLIGQMYHSLPSRAAMLPQRLPHIQHLQRNIVRMPANTLSYNPQAHNKRFTFNLKQLTFLVSQRLSKYETLTHEDIMSYIIKCTHSAASKSRSGFEISEKELLSLKRRTYDSINVMEAIGLLRREKTNKKFLNILWRGYQDFPELDAQLQEQFRIAEHENRIMKEKLRLVNEILKMSEILKKSSGISKPNQKQLQHSTLQKLPQSILAFPLQSIIEITKQGGNDGENNKENKFENECEITEPQTIKYTTSSDEHLLISGHLNVMHFLLLILTGTSKLIEYKLNEKQARAFYQKQWRGEK